VNTAQKLKHYIATEIMYADDDALSEDEPLLGSGIIDSLGIMRLVSYIEEEFGVEVPEDQLVPEHFRTVTALAQFVDRLQHRA
jgi:acyl carrier protein